MRATCLGQEDLRIGHTDIVLSEPTQQSKPSFRMNMRRSLTSRGVMRKDVGSRSKLFAWRSQRWPTGLRARPTPGRSTKTPKLVRVATSAMKKKVLLPGWRSIVVRLPLSSSPASPCSIRLPATASRNRGTPSPQTNMTQRVASIIAPIVGRSQFNARFEITSDEPGLTWNGGLELMCLSCRDAKAQSPSSRGGWRLPDITMITPGT